MYNRIMKKILVVDDMHSFREFHKRILEEVFIELEQTEYTIHTADYARDGLNKIYEHSKEPYDTIITDLQMEDEFSPQYAGEWLVEQIKNMPSYYKTRIIIVSGTYTDHGAGTASSSSGETISGRFPGRSLTYSTTGKNCI